MADKRAKKRLRIIALPVAPTKSIAPTKPERLGIQCITFLRRKVCGRNGRDLAGSDTSGRYFVPKKSSCLCSAHSADSCFEHKPVSLTDATGEAMELKRRLIKGSVPTRTAVVPYTSPLTDRKRRRVSEVYLYLNSLRRTWRCFASSLCNALKH